jgi:DNA-binding CsgD family transcriptional regulator
MAHLVSQTTDRDDLALGIIERPALRAMVLNAPSPVVLLDAPAGMGKSVLLGQIARHLRLIVHRSTPPADPLPGSLTLWDIARDTVPDDLPDAYVSGIARVVIAKRPTTHLPSLARAKMYGNVSHFRVGDLLFSREELRTTLPARMADRRLKVSGGWPMLLARPENERAEDAVEFLVAELLSPMPATELVGIRSWLDGNPAPEIEPGLLTLLGSVQMPLATALDTIMQQRLSNTKAAAAIASALAGADKTTEAILAYQDAGQLDEALAEFRSGGGRFYLYRHGSAAFDRVLAGFPAEFAADNDVLVMSLAMQALKRGEIARARRLVGDRFGLAANDIHAVFSGWNRYSVDFLSFRVVMLIYEDHPITDELLEQVFSIVAHFGVGEDLLRGSFYNAVLEFYIRGRRFDAAEDVAVRAADHYERAGTPLLAFYISVHRAILRLMMGNAGEARKLAADARAKLSRVAFDSPGDQRLVALLDACVDYEAGHAEPMAAFLSTELDDFVHGEIWPSLVEFVLLYGSQALSEHFSTIAARGFLDRWRVHQVSDRQFGSLIELREVAILQNANRWREASDKLAAIPSRITHSWVAAAGNQLQRLDNRDDIALSMAWLRHLVNEAPTRPWLAQQIAALHENLNLTGRQRLSLEVWQAFSAKRQNNLTQARATLLKVFEQAGRLDAIAPLAEEKVFLSELIDHQRIGQYLDASPSARQVLRRLRDVGLPNSELGAQSGLSRRETKVLLMVAEGSSNKFIAHALGLSEATVKFHLSNVYRKLGCNRRRDAIIAARALGLVR